MRSFPFLLVLIFISSCITLPSTPEEPVGPGTAFTGIIGGKGLQVGFVPNNPPLDKIDGSFGVAIKFFNFNVEPVTVDSFSVRSSGQYPGFPQFDDESITDRKSTR